MATHTKKKPKAPVKEKQIAATAPVASDPLVLEVDGLHYELDKAPVKSGKKVVARVRLASGQDGAGFVDTVDLYRFRSRRDFASLVGSSFGRTVDVVLGHLAVLLDQVERSMASARRPEPVVLTAERRAKAEKLLVSTDLLNRAAKIMTDLGYVGEDSNKRLCYLVATSRLLAKPLSTILRAESGSGKSDLLDKIALLLPDESVEYLSRVTPHALYYAGADHLRHKVVIVDEAAGTTEADYAIRTLQTKGYLRLALSVKGKTEHFMARGPIALLSGTTSPDLNPENLSRCLSVSLDESHEQTERIQAAQRRAWAGKEKGSVDVGVWQDAQRLLEPGDVVIPYAERLSFPARTTADRREQMKLLTLVAAHALLHGRQRGRDERDRIVATVADYAGIYALVRPVVESTLDGLSPRGAELYRELARSTEKSITRRQAAAKLGWSYMTTKRALAELADHELVRSTRRGKPMKYRLIETSLLGSGAALTPPEEVAQ